MVDDGTPLRTALVDSDLPESGGNGDAVGVFDGWRQELRCHHPNRDFQVELVVGNLRLLVRMACGTHVLGCEQRLGELLRVQEERVEVPEGEF